MSSTYSPEELSDEVCEECGHSEATTEAGLATYACHCEYPYGPAEDGMDQETWEAMNEAMSKDN